MTHEEILEKIAEMQVMKIDIRENRSTLRCLALTISLNKQTTGEIDLIVFFPAILNQQTLRKILIFEIQNK